MKHRVFSSVAIALIALSTLGVIYATTYTYRWGDFTLDISAPRVWFEDPQYPNVYVELYNYKTKALVNITAGNIGARLLNRSGVAVGLTQGRDCLLV